MYHYKFSLTYSSMGVLSSMGSFYMNMDRFGDYSPISLKAELDIITFLDSILIVWIWNSGYP